MGINIETAKKAEKIARELSKKYYGSEAMWEVSLFEAYQVILKEEKRSGKVKVV